MKVKCIKLGDNDDLVLGQEYIVIDNGYLFYWLDGIECGQYKYCFEIVEE